LKIFGKIISQKFRTERNKRRYFLALWKEIILCSMWCRDSEGFCVSAEKDFADWPSKQKNDNEIK